MTGRMVILGLASAVAAVVLVPAVGARSTAAPALGVHWVSERPSSTHSPDAALAVGPSDLIDATNAGIWHYGKKGNLERYARGRVPAGMETYAKFFGAAGIPSSYISKKCCVDPRAMWDGALQRFWVSAMNGTCSSCKDAGTGARGTSYVFVALSDGPRVNGRWHALALDETINSNGAHEPDWCDYDQIGFNAQTLFVSCDMISESAAENPDESGSDFARVRVISKCEFTALTGKPCTKPGSSSPAPTCGVVPCSWWDLERETDANGKFSFEVAPARMYDTGTGYEFLLNAESGNATTLTVRRISDAQLCCDGDTTTHPSVAKWFVSVPPYRAPSAAKQKGSSKTLRLGSAKIQSAFYYNGWLYGSQAVSCLDSVSCVQIDAIGFQGSTPVAPDHPVLRFGVPGLYDYFPALAPADSGRMTVVFGQSGPSEYPRVDFAGIEPATRLSSSCPCLAGIGTLAAGTHPYTHTTALRAFTSPGDYFAAAIDPDFRHVWIHGNLGGSTDAGWTSVVGETAP